MIYKFEDLETGERVDVDFPMADAPGMGTTIRRKGRELRRLVTMPGAPQVSKNEYKCYQVARNSCQSEGADGYDRRGVPTFKNKASLENWAAKKTGDGIIPITMDD